MKVKELHQHIDALTEGYEIQLNRFCQLQMLSKKQQQALAENQVDAVIELLNQRGNLMKEVDELNIKLNEIQNHICKLLHLKEFSLTKLGELVSYPGLTQLGKILAQISGLMLEISQLDTGNQKELTDKINQCRLEFKKIKNGNQARHAYLEASDQYAEARFFDRTK